MFVIDPNPQFTHTVKVRVPVDGGFEAQSFKATFNVIPTDEVKTFNLSEGEGSTDFLKRAVIGMSDLVDLERQPVPYNDEVRDALFRKAYVRTALTRTYFEAVAGAQLGN